jgi:vWA-MoxR associated protein C-terminal domain/Trypsin-like peptidase domain
MKIRYSGVAGIDPEQVAILKVTCTHPGPKRRGSGYRVSVSAILTAAHVVCDAATVEVQFNADRPGEWVTQGRVLWSDPVVDAAVVGINPLPDDQLRVSPAQFGRVAERDVELDCSAMGFPWFKLRDDPGQRADSVDRSRYRDSAHARGKIAALANRREGTLEVRVPPPDRDPDPNRSPWEGMSGAAVWSGGRIIGIIAEHHRKDGLNRLAATRIDHWYEDLAPGKLDELRRLLPQLPHQRVELTDVTGLPGEPVQVRDGTAVALSKDVQDAFRRVFTSASVPVGPPVSWTLPELSELRRKVTDNTSELAVTLTALYEALEAKPVFLAIGGRSLGLDRLQVTYLREIGAWPRGSSVDALLVEAASADVVKSRRPGQSLGALTRFVVRTAALLGVPPDGNELLRDWIDSRDQLGDALRHYTERREDPAWLLIDLGDEPRPGEAPWPTKVTWTLMSSDRVVPGEPITCEATPDALRRALSQILADIPPARPLLVDLAVPRALMDLGIEHWPVYEIDGIAEPLSTDCHPRLRWSMRRRDEKLLNRVRDRIEHASWKGGAKQWLRNDPRHACFLGGADVEPSPADPLRMLLRDGCGFVIWFRTGLTDPALRQIAKAIRKMPVQARRSNLPDYLPAFAPDHPVIIWDDPIGRSGFELPTVKPESP